MSEAEEEELGKKEEETGDGEEEKGVAEVGDAVRSIFGRVVGGVVHGRLEDGLAFGQDGVHDGRV